MVALAYEAKLKGKQITGECLGPANNVLRFNGETNELRNVRGSLVLVRSFDADDLPLTPTIEDVVVVGRLLKLQNVRMVAMTGWVAVAVEDLRISE